MLDRLQAAMSVIEGHAEHVMDAAAGASTEPGYARLRDRLDARRARRGGLGEVISRLLGMELKLRQYKLGKAFCDAIVEEAGIDGLNRVWPPPRRCRPPTSSSSPRGGSSGWAGDRPRPRPEPVETLAPTA